MAVHVTLPTLHADQVRAYAIKDPKTGKRARLNAIRCGRRWGKTALGKTIACNGATKKKRIGWFAPDYKRSSESYEEILDVLAPIKKRSSKTEGVIRTKTGGLIDFWTLDDESAGRSRKYHTVIIDEGAFTKPNMMGIWEKSILPTLLDYQGSAYVLSNTNGNDPENFFWQICNDPKFGFAQYHAPSWNNPTIPAHLPNETPEAYMKRREAIFDELRKNNHPLVFAQEYAAEFVDWSGVAFFALEKLLVLGNPVPRPTKCDGVFAVIDSATKTGKGNDGTAVVYCAMVKTGFAWKLVILDWDIIQIEGDLLITWLPTVLSNLEDFARKTGARAGSLGAFIEDKDSGQILLQQSARRGLKATAIPSTLTSIGKDERAISVSGYVYQGQVKLSVEAFEKTTMYKGTTKNHLTGQVTGFRVGDRDAAKRADDLLDGFTYSVAIALGNGEGY